MSEKPFVELEFRKGEPATKEEPVPVTETEVRSLRFLPVTEILQIKKFLQELPKEDRQRLSDLLAPLLAELPSPHWDWLKEQLEA